MKRIPRNKIDKSKISFMKPLNIEIFGSAADPCFGKHHEPRATECQQCGDAEICVIVMGQRNHLLRAKQEKITPFKDLHEPQQTYLGFILDQINHYKLKKVLLTTALKDIRNLLIKDPTESLDQIEKDLRGQIKREGHIKIINAKDGKKYVTLI